MILDGVTVFLHKKTNETHVNTSIILVKVLGGIFFHVMAENWKHLKDTLSLSWFLVCQNQNRVLLTSDFLPNILVVGSHR